MTKFLLDEGMDYVLTNRFLQEILKQLFGNFRKFGRRNENPDLQQIGYHDNTVRIQKRISCDSGNTKGRYNKTKSWVNVTDFFFIIYVFLSRDKPTQSQLIQVYSVGWIDVYDTHNIEHRTEPVSY